MSEAEDDVRRADTFDERTDGREKVGEQVDLDVLRNRLAQLRSFSVQPGSECETVTLALAALAELRGLLAEVDLLKGELRATEDGSGWGNVLDQYESQLKAERDAVATLRGEVAACQRDISKHGAFEREFCEWMDAVDFETTGIRGPVSMSEDDFMKLCEMRKRLDALRNSK